MQDTYNDIKPISFYQQYNNTDSLPSTKIIKILEDDYVSFINKNNEEKHSLVFSDLFSLNLDNNFAIKGAIDQQNISNNSSYMLTDLIKSAIYLKSSNFLVNTSPTTYEFQLTNLKYQIGKDVSRTKQYINNTLFDIKQKEKVDSNEEIEENYYQIADKYNNQIIQDYNIPEINFNNLIMMDILSCQNIYNLIGDLLHLFLNDKLKSFLKGDTIILAPSAKMDSNEIPTVSKDKYSEIMVSIQSSIMTIYFDTYLFIASEFIAIGKMNYKITFDLNDNTFLLDELHIDYDLSILEKTNSNETNNTNNTNNTNTERLNKWKQTITNKSQQYWDNTKQLATRVKDKTSQLIRDNPNIASIGIPVGIATVGAATVLGIAALGGKATKKYRNKYKKNKYGKKTSKRKNKKYTRKFHSQRMVKKTKNKYNKNKK